MTIRRINVTPDVPSSIQTVELGGVEYRLELEWRGRLESWYASLYEGEVEEQPIRRYARVVPQQPLFNKRLPVERGLFFVDGPLEDYTRYDLGDKVTILWISASP